MIVFLLVAVGCYKHLGSIVFVQNDRTTFGTWRTRRMPISIKKHVIDLSHAIFFTTEESITVSLVYGVRLKIAEVT